MKIGIHMDNITEQKIIKLKKNGNIIQLFVNNSVQKIKQLLMKYKLKSSGQGSEIGYNFKELAQIYNKLKYLNRFNICLDTAHLYVSGYNLNNFDKVMNEFQEYFNLDDIKVVHLNNTKKELGSKIDRHSNLEDGNINNISHIAYYFIKMDKWIILETPQKKIYEDLEMISDSI